MQNFTPEEIEKINQLQKELLSLIDIVHHTEAAILELPPDDTATIGLYTRGIDKINNEIADIAYDLNSYGGYELMKQTYDMGSKANLDTTLIDSLWDGIGQWASRDQTVNDKIASLQQELLDHTVKLRTLSTELEIELHNDTKWAHEKLNNAIADVSEKYKQIGIKLYTYGGFDLMQSSIYKVSKAGYSIIVIEHAWNGIGEWVV